MKKINIDLKPNIIKIIGSILFAPIASILFLMYYQTLRCLNAICPAGVMFPRPKCKGNEIFLCCHTCIPNSTQRLGLILLMIEISMIFLVLIYVLYSFIQKKKMKFAVFCTFLVLILVFSLFFIIIGSITKEFCWFIGSITLGACILYVICKILEKKKYL